MRTSPSQRWTERLPSGTGGRCKIRKLQTKSCYFALKGLFLNPSKPDRNFCGCCNPGWPPTKPALPVGFDTDIHAVQEQAAVRDHGRAACRRVGEVELVGSCGDVLDPDQVIAGPDAPGAVDHVNRRQVQVGDE